MALRPGNPVEREIAGGETHTYEINLTMGQFVRFRLAQRTVEAALILSAPDGKQLVDMNLTRFGDEESLSLEATATGDYKLTVKGVGLAPVRGAYALVTTVQPTATALDRKRIAAETLLVEAAVLARQGSKAAQQVIEKCEQARAIWQEIGELSWVANSLVKIGVMYGALNRSDKAIESLEKALAIYREIKNRRGEGDAISILGTTHGTISQFEKAVQYFEQELVIYRELKDRNGEASVLGNLGLGYMFLTQYDKALDYLHQGLPIAREVKDQQKEGRILTTMGIVSDRLSRFETAIEYFEQALQLSRAVKDQLGVGNTLMTLGTTYLQIKRDDKAIEYYEQALAIFREAKYRVGEANTLTALGNTYSNLGQHEQAIARYEQSLVILREVKFRSGETTTLNNLGLAYLKLKQPEKAIGVLEQSLAINREIKTRRGEAVALSRMGQALRDLGKFDQSASSLIEALAIARAIGDKIFEVTALSNLAVTENARGNLAHARTYSEDALQIIETLRVAVLSPESRRALFTEGQGSYQLYTDILMRQHKAEPTKGFDVLAVETSERQRARSLLEQLNEARMDKYEGVDSTLLERERSLSQQLNDKAQRLLQASKPEQAEALKKEISQLEIDYERAQVAIRKANPRYAALVQPQPLKLKEIQAQLDADTLLLEYSLNPERSYLWAISKNSLTSYELPKEAEITQSALQVHQLLSARSTTKRGESALQRRQRIAQAEANLPAAAQALSQMLLAPVAQQLGNKRLVIVADGALQYVPFVMLPEPEASNTTAANRPTAPRPLIVSHEIVSLPSASALAIQRSELASRQAAPKLLAVIADPVFDRSDARFKTAATDASDNAIPQARSFDDQRSLEHLSAKSDEKAGDKSGVARHRLVIPRLPFTRQEATRLLALAPRNSSFAAMDFQASNATVLTGELAQYRFVHFATHGVADTEKPWMSSLVLSMVDEKGSPQDGFLRLKDIYNLKLPAELVVLSACQTGIGKEIKGEGMEALTRGFMYAGAARVVVSLWNVNDKATSELMGKFYERMLKRGERPAAALRAAQVEMWRQKPWQSPYYWAAFVLQGEWR
jgi:CHAT domain-containing protein/tetratricopeptide (TPR) repeat protein